MDAEYVYCPHCGYEHESAFPQFVAYSRTTADGKWYLCPECGEEIGGVQGEEDLDWDDEEE